MKRLNIEDPNVWNTWRELYDILTDEEQIEFHNECESKYPSQQHFTFSNYEHLFMNEAPISPRVIEIGGWKGELAKKCLELFPIDSWCNFELCRAAVDNKVLYHEKYSCVLPAKMRWFNEFSSKDKYDVCIASHTIEYLSDYDFKSLVKFIAGIPFVIFEATIKLEHDNWTDYQGTHILKMGWFGVCEEMFMHGYKARRLNEQCMIFSLNGFQ